MGADFGEEAGRDELFPQVCRVLMTDLQTHLSSSAVAEA